MSAKDGGNAFPVPNLQDDESFNGMSLRDYFAAHAPEVPDWFQHLQWQTEATTKVSQLGDPGRYAKVIERHIESGPQRIARWNYSYADAMIAERGK